MRGWGTGARFLFFGTFFAVASQFTGAQANAGLSAQSAQSRHNNVRLASRSRPANRYAYHGAISCVPYARAASGITVSGNAWEWWQNAAGVYARGSVPEPGSVLTFRSNGRMRLGHVAVVSTVINSREIEIDHANWWGPGMQGGIAKNIPVVDVSENNDWTAVRVGLGQSGDFGSVYPTYGFIYDRPDNGMMVASAIAPAPKPVLNPAPSDLRPATERGWDTYEEVAEAPQVARYHGRVVHTVSYHTTKPHKHY
ncbi:MAG TPA: CHAP domain-containing protein [Acetobacteraceae bacterium]|jgi:surface antigen|nr:CHAP domain-containing protein [Acetobacteraceae bacterium]